jgi:hypothetical protein
LAANFAHKGLPETGQGAEAAAEARKVIDYRGEGPRSLLWPLAHLNLARALVMQRDTVQAKQMYEEFFKLWQNADADLPILIEARGNMGSCGEVITSSQDAVLGQGQNHLAVAGGYVVDALRIKKGCAPTRYREVVLTVSKLQL